MTWYNALNVLPSLIVPAKSSLYLLFFLLFSRTFAPLKKISLSRFLREVEKDYGS